MDDSSLERVNEYLNEGHKLVAGWSHQADLLLMACAAIAQRELSVTGTTCEVGVFQGKSLILQALLLSESERLHGIDLFSNDNLDQTNRNLDRFAPNKEKISLHKVNTLDLSADALQAMMSQGMPLRYLHIDAGHEYFEVFHDLLLFTPLLREQGILVMDDVYDRETPGLTLALAHFCAIAAPNLHLVPFMVGINKLFLCREAHASMYQATISKQPSLAHCTRLSIGPKHGLLVPFSKFPMDAEGLQRAIASPVNFSVSADVSIEKVRLLARDFGPAEIWRSMERRGRAVKDLLS